MAGDDAESSRPQAVGGTEHREWRAILTDFAVLETLSHKGPLSISELQDKVLPASGSMTAAIDRLQERGLVVRKSASKDRRARIVELTREKKLVAATLFEKHPRDLEALLWVLSAKEKKQMYESLKKLGCRQHNNSVTLATCWNQNIFEEKVRGKGF